MNPNTAARLIETQLAGILSSARTAWPNVPFTPPTIGQWSKVDIVWGDSFIVTKDLRNSINGIVQVTHYQPKDQGDGFLLSLIDGVRILFNRALIAGTGDGDDIRFRVPSGPRGGYEGNWRTMTITCPFTVDEIGPF